MLLYDDKAGDRTVYNKGLKMETVCFSEALVSIYEPIQSHDSEGQNRYPL
jgi:hypothetical protein